MAVYVISKNGERLMPTTRYGKVRHLLESGRAVIYKHDPFTIQLTYEASTYTQPIEFCEDTGYQYVGLSLKSLTCEYESRQYQLLTDEKQRHDDCRKYRRTRRSRLRYRAPRFNNRNIPKGWLAPSLKNKADRQFELLSRFAAVTPITSAVFEVGQFDTQLLKAIQEGTVLPQGVDYQHGDRYAVATLREAVFQRDGYICQCCGKSILSTGRIGHVHHMLFWKGRHGNSLSELMTCCDQCHTPANHQPKGKLWGLEKKLKSLSGAAFMNTVKWYIYNSAKSEFPDVEVKLTYGAMTKTKRSELGLSKSHVDDAYAMGNLHPIVRAETQYLKKRRRNNRVLAKFYDAKYRDSRDGKVKTGKELFNGRTNRDHSRDTENLHPYRSKKVSKGRVSVRKEHYSVQPHDVIEYNKRKYIAIGCQNCGEYVSVRGRTPVPIKGLTVIHHSNGWVMLSQ